jgi:hypothetical protein
VIVNIGKDTWSLTTDELVFSEIEDAFDLEVLASLGLCRRVNEYFRSKFGHEIHVVYYHVSELGVRFFVACKDTKLGPATSGRESP